MPRTWFDRGSSGCRSVWFRRALAALLISLIVAALPFDVGSGVSRSTSDVARAASNPPLPPVRPVTGRAGPHLDLPAFGVVAINFDANDLAQAKQIGAESVLMGIVWSDIEPARTSPPTYQWNQVDAQVDLIRKSGLEPFVVVTGNPDWAATGDYRILTQFGRAALAEFMAAAQTRYRGRIRLWSFYNEPDCNGPTAPPWGFALSACYGAYGREYTAMLKAVYPAIKRVDPDAYIIMGGLAYEDWTPSFRFSREFLDEVLASGGGNYFDILNFHYYVEFAHHWAPYGNDVAGKTNYLRGVLAKYGVSKPIILTEIGKAGTIGGDELQADYVIQGQTRALAAGNDLVLWYELADDESHPGYRAGLIRGDGTFKAGAYTYKLLTERLRDVTALGCPDTYPGVEAYSFRTTDNSRWELVAWSSDNLTRTISVEAEKVTRYDRHNTAGLALPPIRTADGQIAVAVGPRPAIFSVTPRKISSPGHSTAFRVFLPTLTRGDC